MSSSHLLPTRERAISDIISSSIPPMNSTLRTLKSVQESTGTMIPLSTSVSMSVHSIGSTMYANSHQGKGNHGGGLKSALGKALVQQANGQMGGQWKNEQDKSMMTQSIHMSLKLSERGEILGKMERRGNGNEAGRAMINENVWAPPKGSDVEVKSYLGDDEYPPIAVQRPKNAQHLPSYLQKPKKSMLNELEREVAEVDVDSNLVSSASLSNTPKGRTQIAIPEAIKHADFNTPKGKGVLTCNIISHRRCFELN